MLGAQRQPSGCRVLCTGPQTLLNNRAKPASAAALGPREHREARRDRRGGCWRCSRPGAPDCAEPPVTDPTPAPNITTSITSEAKQEESFLETLCIRDLALVKSARVQFAPGLNVITGQSGAGKSVLLQAISLVTGSTASADAVRQGANEALVEATFRLSPEAAVAVSSVLRHLGLPEATLPTAQHGRVTLRRSVVAYNEQQQPDASTPASPHGPEGPTLRTRSTCFINSAAAPMRALRHVGAALVDMNCQNSGVAVRTPATQLALLDAIAGTASHARAFGRGLDKLKAIRKRICELEELGDEEQRSADAEVLERIDALELQAGEEDSLAAYVRRMDGLASSMQDASLVHAVIGSRSDEGTMLFQLASAASTVEQVRRREARDAEAMQEEDSLEPVSGSKAAVEQLARQLQEAGGLLEDAREQVARYVDLMEFDPEEFSAAKSRLAQIRRLLSDCSCNSTAQLLELAEDARTIIQKWEELADELPALQEDERALSTRLATDAVRLSQRRRAACGHLRLAVERCLADLAMPHSRFDVRISWQQARRSDQAAWQLPRGQAASSPDGLCVGEAANAVGEMPDCEYVASDSGLDQVEFLLAAGPTEPLCPLASVASGGESARLMLALKAAPKMAAQSMQDDTTHALQRIEATADQAEAPTEVLSASSEYPLQPPRDVSAHSQQPAVLTIEPVGSQQTIHPMGSARIFDNAAFDAAQFDRELAALACPVLVFDEIDAGLGPRLGACVGRTLKRISTGGQILCVSHVPQVAAYGDRHVLVRKAFADGEPCTHVDVLGDGRPRITEIAAMIGLDETIAAQLMHDAAHDSQA